MDPELRDALNQLAADLRGEIRSGAAETRAYVDARVGTYATETRRHFEVIGESLRGEIRALAEAMALNHEGTGGGLARRRGGPTASRAES